MRFSGNKLLRFMADGSTTDLKKSIAKADIIGSTNDAANS